MLIYFNFFISSIKGSHQGFVTPFLLNNGKSSYCKPFDHFIGFGIVEAVEDLVSRTSIETLLSCERTGKLL